MTSARMTRIMGDPPMRHLAYADDLKRMEDAVHGTAELVEASQHWRDEYLPRIKRELVASKKQAETVEERVRHLWDAGTPIGVIAERTGLELGRVYELVSAE